MDEDERFSSGRAVLRASVQPPPLDGHLERKLPRLGCVESSRIGGGAEGSLGGMSFSEPLAFSVVNRPRSLLSPIRFARKKWRNWK